MSLRTSSVLGVDVWKVNLLQLRDDIHFCQIEEYILAGIIQIQI